jgi:hypothetical protein
VPVKLEHDGARDVYTWLPAGAYRVLASLSGHELPARHVHVTSGGHENAAFIWPQNVA